MIIPRNPIVEFRKQRNLSRADLANLIGVSYSLVGQWEAGYHKPPPTYLEKLTVYGLNLKKFDQQWDEYVMARRDATIEDLKGNGYHYGPIDEGDNNNET